MKRILLTLIIGAACVHMASAQLLPSVQFGLKGGMNFTSLSSSAATTFSNRAGYLGGLWLRFGALGFNFQPEIYATSKNINITENGVERKAKFSSIDVPLLFGGKVGAFGIGGRFYTGPVAVFAINKDQGFTAASQNATSLNYKDQNFAWQFGAGLDIKHISIDLRYEAGITKQSYGTSQTRVNLFNISLAYSLLKF